MNEVPVRFSPDGGYGPGGSESQGAVEAAAAPPAVMNYLRVVKRWRWLLLGVIALCGVAGLVVTLLMAPKYTASATLEIQRETARITNVEGVEPRTTSSDNEFYQTQYGLLKASSLAERVARNLKLESDAGFFERSGAKAVAQQLRDRSPQSLTPAAREQRVRQAAKILLGAVTIAPTRLSRLVDVSYTSTDPEFAARVSNAWTKAFIESNLERKFDATAYARQFLEQRLGQLRQRLEESERLLVDYAAKEQIVTIPTTIAGANGTTSEGAERPLVAENLSALNSELNQAIAARVTAESRLRGSGGNTTEALQNQAISSLRQRRAEVAADYAKTLSQFTAEYPAAQALAAQLSQLDKAISREEGRVSGTLQSTYRSALAREQALQQRVNGLRTDLLGVRSRSIQYNIYQREVDTNRQLYDGLLQRYKEIGVSAGVGVNNVSVVDAAEVPKSPSSPNLLLNLIASLMVGCAIGAVLVLALDQIDEAISDPNDVERVLGLPLLGTIPKVGGENPRNALEDPKSPLVEAYLSAQTSLAFSTDHGIPASLMVTSTRPAEGKTTSSYALARSLARTGRKVILIDADMRSPSLHSVFGVDNTQGLSNYLAGAGDVSQFYRPDRATGIAFMPAGPQPPNAAELLSGERLAMLLNELSLVFDHVILDVPPVMGLADAPLIASRVEGAIFVVESHATRSSVARLSINRLLDARARVLGVLLTKFEARRAHYGYGYDYGYGYGREDEA
ncbi:MAG: polysaccharide biosynthesis tyrosine autokinase [Alphaproteobacteria bacterium]|nr:MAG: polysaccharide biosynthesis tyrosine autokinase [Alphaproteobacteria bacterium]